MYQNNKMILIIDEVEIVSIYNCQYLANYLSNGEFAIKQFNKINKIKQWYKRIKLSKKLWLYAELVIMDSMNPHKENNQYLEKYIEDKVYKE